MPDLAKRLFAHHQVGVFIQEVFRSNGHDKEKASTAVEDPLSKPVAEPDTKPDVNHVVPTENEQTDKRAKAEGDALEHTSTSPAEIPPKIRPKKKTKTPVVEVGPTYEPGPYIYIKDVAELEKVLPSLLDAPELAIDLETTGLSHIRDRTRLVQLATPAQAVLIDAFHVPVEMLAPILQGNRTLYGQNLKFDDTVASLQSD
jgi:hypothetical protein